MIASIFLILIFVVIAGFFSGIETGAYRLNRIRLRSETQAGSLLARITEKSVSNMERFVCVTIIGNNMAVYGASAFCTAIIAEHVHSGAMAELISTIVLAPILLLVADVIPKSLFQVLPNRLMRASAPLIWISEKVFYVVVVMLTGVVALWRKLIIGGGGARQAVVSAQYLNTLLAAGGQEGVITSQQDIMARNILQLAELPLSQVMVPLARVKMIPAELSGEPALREIEQSDHSRLPVYENDRSNIIGMLKVDDYLCDARGVAVRDSLSPMLRIESMSHVDEAFRRLQIDGQIMAVVTDQSGKAIGIVTVDDLLTVILKRTGT